MNRLEWKPGASLPERVKEPISLEQLLRYAEASGDDNPIHTHEEVARSVGLPGVIAHGMLSMGFLGEYVAGFFGPEHVRSLKARFREMVRIGDVLTCRGTIRDIRPPDPAEGMDRALARLQLWVENQEGIIVTRGEAEVLGPPPARHTIQTGHALK